MFVVADVYRREQRLGITPKFQYPLFRSLLWYAARSMLGRWVGGRGTWVA